MNGDPLTQAFSTPCIGHIWIGFMRASVGYDRRLICSNRSHTKATPRLRDQGFLLYVGTASADATNKSSQKVGKPLNSSNVDCNDLAHILGT
jgi:hypothetical protein